MARTNDRTATSAEPTLIRWGAVFGGVILGMSVMLLLAALWIGIGFGAGTETVTANLAWFMTGSAITAMLAGGFLAGWLAGVPGAAPGFFNGLTVWGLILIGSLAIGIPGALQAITIDPAMLAGAEAEVATQGQTLWAPFISLLIGAIAAGLGGALGGMTTRPATVYTGEVVTAGHRRAEDGPREAPAAEPTHRKETVDLRDDEARAESEATTRPR